MKHARAHQPGERYGPNGGAVAGVLDHASTLLNDEASSLAAAMIHRWSWGRTTDRFPPFVAALGAACGAAVSSGRVHHVRAARAAVHLPRRGGWDGSATVATVGVRITVAALVVADLLTAEQRVLLLGPWRTLASSGSRRADIA